MIGDSLALGCIEVMKGCILLSTAIGELAPRVNWVIVPKERRLQL
jgi:hypothetical protein